jgi:hypothetical protein
MTKSGLRKRLWSEIWDLIDEKDELKKAGEVDSLLSLFSETMEEVIGEDEDITKEALIEELRWKGHLTEILIKNVPQLSNYSYYGSIGGLVHRLKEWRENREQRTRLKKMTGGKE